MDMTDKMGTRLCQVEKRFQVSDGNFFPDLDYVYE